MNIIDPTICGWAPAPLIFISDNVTGFLAYSHLFPPLIALIVTTVVIINNPRHKAGWWLFFVSTMFSLWCVMDLIIWASDRSDIIMFVWSSLIYVDLLIFVGAAYFMYALINQKSPPWWGDLLVVVLFLPLFLFAHTQYNLVAFDFTNCFRDAFEGPLWQVYVYTIELVVALWILLYALYVTHLQPNKVARKLEISLAAIGTVAMLSMFSFGNIIGTFSDWEASQWGLYGMPIFMVLLTYLMVRFHTFNVKVVSTDAFVTGQFFLIASLLFINSIEYLRIIVLFTLTLTIALGLLLMRTMRREIRERTRNEGLAHHLEKTNERLKVVDKMKTEFVSIASHQLRSPLTTIRSYASTLIDGSFGELSPKIKEAVEHIHESSVTMAVSIDDFLNTSRIESGNLTYDLTYFDLGPEVARIVEDQKLQAKERGLTVGLVSKLTEPAIVHADLNKVNQILHNLAHNAVKYTTAGTIMLTIDKDDEAKVVVVEVTDTGIGLSPETIETLFTKFERTDRAKTIDPHGTGLGLFIARTMARKMGGDVVASSPGEGKGSTFRLTLPQGVAK